MFVVRRRLAPEVKAALGHAGDQRRLAQAAIASRKAGVPAVAG